MARKRARTIRGVAKKNIKKLSNRELLLVGVALYWGEGYKRVIIRNGKETTSHPVHLQTRMQIW
ncbi:MAG: hypothetical protein JKX80_01190 [Candidatus Pacebacteria bacterium]|nr:hypothetical protein [Candidatus Paceibacterota bacterium]